MKLRGRLRQVISTKMVALLVLALASVSAAQSPPGSTDLYLKYCSSCHGETGNGNGPVSGLLTPRPTDLTQIAQKAGGQFPFMQVMQAIDGTKTIRAHGQSEMPVWGEAFRKDLPPQSLSAQERLRGQLMLITEYVASIQAK